MVEPQIQQVFGSTVQETHILESRTQQKVGREYFKNRLPGSSEIWHTVSGPYVDGICEN